MTNATQKTETQTQAPATVQKTYEDWVKEIEGLKSKSAQVRYLNAQGMKTGDIAKLLTKYYYTDKKIDREFRYQHVRNVLMTKLSSEQ